jgi:hypothetical protein
LDGFAGLKFLFAGQFKHFVAILRAHYSFYSNFKVVFKERSKHFELKKYATINSIVWRYYILKKKKYNNLNKTF